ncbi:STM4014 family protein [Rubinisphaera sp.]|mgnify:CR=1 FL=1|uniref:STM4014 family protein n=1 Tax=Rubinisphaera sp. TaxID=2024857 RepID=UPI000C119DD7|nr:STM4014 family protein [Rubinisphaera sp.]MBV11905.1 hypothetical protein [Rubinisphaera sp.]HCS51541.1 hypothetical protein [Planctomycetaceae bacterium]|tara:strand:- start:6847 stop:7959 length:1113 start_codon:yes stop_codon:yes gene_type:complete
MSHRNQAHWILGDPDGQRVADYRAAAARCGLQRPRCIAWTDVINDGLDLFDEIPSDSRLRIDSFGQNQAAIAALIRHGGGLEIPQIGQILSLNHQYRGLCRVLRALNDWSVNRPDIELDQQPGDIELMFDKWATHRKMMSCRPETTLLPTESLEFFKRLALFVEDCGGRVFVKPRYASSASGVCCYRVSNNRQQLIAPVEIVRDSGHIRLFNSLRVRSYTSTRDIHDIFTALAPQGMIAEAAVNKARINGDRFDLRIVVINGRADHLIARQSSSPITNLHLGNTRASLESVCQVVGMERLQSCRHLALHAANHFPETLYCGVDILLPKSGSPLVCEVNAFGDFLPNLIANGQTVYEAILKSNGRNLEVLV